MKVAVYCSQPQYLAHLQPIVDATGGEVWGDGRGELPELRSWHPLRAADVVMVASFADADRLRAAHLDRLVHVEHGAGQTYHGDPRGVGRSGYAGGAEMDHVGLFLAPGEASAVKWRAAYPQARTAAVGCPMLDRWHTTVAKRTGPPTVAFSFHWELKVVPETRGAWSHVDPHLPWIVAELARLGWRVIGHGHPRLRRRLDPRWRAVGVEPVSYESVMAEADVLVCDNSSIQWESMSVGVGQVFIDAPWYRLDVEHGLRFWAHAEAGERVIDPRDIPGAVGVALDPSDREAQREAALADVYAFRDGRATERAVAAIEEMVG